MKSNYRSTAAGAPTRSRGFTLIEILVTIAIVGIALGLAMPAMQSFIQSGRLTSAASEMQAALARARQEAIARSTFVTVEPLGTGWASGYRIYVNPLNKATWAAADAAGNLGTGTSVITREIIGQGATSSSSELQWPTNACDSSTALTYATFDEGGRPRAALTGATRTGRITACTATGSCSTPKSCKEILVDALGRMRVQAN